jgi:DNA polymerase-3 subunit delta'
MPFTGIAGHSASIATIRRTLASGRTAHAYLFSGPDGVGKKKIATAFIEALFCGNDEGCGTCPSCKKIASGNHPDIHLLEPDGQFIKVDQVRDLQKELAYRPYEAPRKACIIDGADRFNPSSGNSLLKTLEEPPGNAIIILLCSNADAVLPTIRSRCQLISISGVPAEELVRHLSAQGFAAETAGVAAALSGGSFAKALALCNEEIMTERTALIRSACSLSNKSLTGVFEFSEQFDKDREKTLQALDILISFWRDMLHLRNGVNEHLNSDLAPLIEQETWKRSTENLLFGIENLTRTRQAILRNANVRLAMDVVSMQLAT